MPEAGYLPIPQKLLRAGVKDMVRISDARMSGTAFGTIVLHVTPEAAVGGPLALVATGDRIRMSVKERKLDLLVDEAELARRRASWRPATVPERGYRKLYMDHVLQADLGCDFDFLRARQELLGERGSAPSALVDRGVTRVPMNGLLDPGDLPARGGAAERVGVGAVGVESLAILGAETVDHRGGDAGGAVALDGDQVVGAEVKRLEMLEGGAALGHEVGG
jgi:hypothetical protein